ncbi:MAG: hypothetical protein GY737_29790 [Desulfobacteraceae bacterium]|nr:hypothetical protein [Desulfobacteraceae bacterium]
MMADIMAAQNLRIVMGYCRVCKGLTSPGAAPAQPQGRAGPTDCWWGRGQARASKFCAGPGRAPSLGPQQPWYYFRIGFSSRNECHFFSKMI